MLRYGVFNLGQYWFVVGEGAQVGFADRASALDAATLICNAQRGRGEEVELLVQDAYGRLTVVTEASETARTSEEADEAGAGAVLRMRPPAVSLRVVH